MSTGGQRALSTTVDERGQGSHGGDYPILAPLESASSTDARDVLLVQEDENIRGVWASALRSAGYIPHPLETIEALLESLLEIRHWRAIVVDLGFRGPEATTFLDQLRANQDAIPLLLTAWEGSLAGAKPVKAYPGLVFVAAPLQPRGLVATVRALPAPPLPKRQKPSSGMTVVHKPEAMMRAEREKSSLLPEAVLARADAEKWAEEGRLPRHEPALVLELERAREIQRRLLPGKIAQPDGFEIAARYLPAEHVGGDYFDVIPLPDGRIAMLVADVSGKGISAAMVMVMARTVFHSVSPWVADARQLVLQAADRIAHDLPGGVFISLACGLLDPSRGTISIVNAGHLPPLHWSIQDGRPFVATLDVSGGAIGLLKSPHFQRTLLDGTLTLQPGEQLVFFTDGVNEAMDRDSEEYGDKRLHNAMMAGGGTTADGMAQAIVDSVERHRGSAPVSDDITVLVVKRK